MIGLLGKVRVFVQRTPVDMRKSFDTLSGVVRQQMGSEITSGDVYLFVGRDRRRAKVLYFDGTGLCLLCKRLSTGRFSAPWQEGGRAEMTTHELALFLEGCTLVGKVALSVPPMRSAALTLGPEAFI